MKDNIPQFYGYDEDVTESKARVEEMLGFLEDIDITDENGVEDEGYKRIIDALKKRARAKLFFNRECSGVNRACIWWQQGICLCKRKDCMPEAGESADTKDCVFYRVANADVNAKALCRHLVTENKRLREEGALYIEHMHNEVSSLRAVIEQLKDEKDELAMQLAHKVDPEYKEPTKAEQLAELDEQVVKHLDKMNNHILAINQSWNEFSKKIGKPASKNYK